MLYNLRMKGVGTVNERLKLLRKSLGLTQEEFADRLGIKRSAVSNYEIGRNVPIDAVVSLICREFRVNGEWLRSGVGEMFVAAPTSALDALAREFNLSQKDYVLIEKLVGLSPKERDGIFRFMENVVDGARACGADPYAPVFPPDSGGGEALDTVDSLCEAIRRQYGDEKEAGGASEAS